jgi:hypothetical protein
MEKRLISELNDCIWPRSRIPLNEFPEDLKGVIENSEFVGIEGDYFVVKKERKSWFCKVIGIADRQPDLVVLCVVLTAGIGVYGFVVYQQARARSLLPGVIQTIKNGPNRMCFVDDVRGRLEANGVSTFWTWRFIVPLINRTKGIRRVEVKCSKPFWSFGDDQ